MELVICWFCKDSNANNPPSRPGVVEDVYVNILRCEYMDFEYVWKSQDETRGWRCKAKIGFSNKDDLLDTVKDFELERFGLIWNANVVEFSLH